MEQRTIAAIATAMSPGGISVIRISGPEAFEVADRVFRSKKAGKRLCEQETHTIHYGYIFRNEEMIDEVLVLLMRGPKSYTAEDTVEIDCHGGVLVTKRILETVLENGASPADPGEFTKRAFLNGRIDLSRAEAVMDLIQAKNEFARKNAVSQLNGKLYFKIKDFRDMILDGAAQIEAALDDPEQISLEGFCEKLDQDLDGICIGLDEMLADADNGRMLAEGIRTVILGRPNAGKSSLLNLLSGQERAIVTEIAGTTRDTLEEQILLGGIGFRLVDTAGIRSTEDIVEKIGVSKAMEQAENADLILYVVDGSMPLDENDEQIIGMIQDKKAVVLLNKSDLPLYISEEELKEKTGKKVITVSAKEFTGFKRLENVLCEMFLHREVQYNDEVWITNIRQKENLRHARESLQLVRESISQNMPEDFLTIDLMNAYMELGYILGEEVEDDMVDRVFSKFCMGK